MQDIERKKLLAAAIAKRDALKRNLCFDPFKIDSKPSPKQQAPLEDRRNLHIYVVAGNQSGKSTIGARRTAWMFTESDPYWERPNSNRCNLCKSTNIGHKFSDDEGIEIQNDNFQCHDCDHQWIDWTDEPLLIIVAGRTTDQLDKLWNTKIKPYLPKNSYNRPKKQGGVIKEVVHKTNGNTILFTSHDKAREAAEKVQSYVAHFVWLDEMPGDYKYIEELHRRCDSRRAQFIATFTPKSRNEKIRGMVDNVDPSIGIKYQMGKLDNPIYWGREEEERAKIAHLPLEEQLTILEGAWQGAEDKVFFLEKEHHVDRLPSEYSPLWPHIVATDPAASGKAGFLLMARDPSTGKWWITQAAYMEGKAPSDAVMDVENRIKPYNIARRIYDPAAAGFSKEAAKRKISYMGVYNKSQRKLELITNVQQAMRDGWLMFGERLYDLFGEMNDAEWNLDRNGIRRSTKYHLLDALQYALDNLPKQPKEFEVLTRDQRIMKVHQESRMVDATRKVAQAMKRKKRYHRVGKRRLRQNVGL
jgi:phage terminase large subunit-like protein